MSALVGTVMEPNTVVGSGRYVAATPKMELGSLAPTPDWPAPTGFEIQGYVVGPPSGASMPRFEVPIILSTQHVTQEYLQRYVIEPGRAKRAAAETLADALEQAMSHLSVVRRSQRYPAFWDLQRMGETAVALALDRLKGSYRPLWLYFLQRARVERVAKDASSVEEAARLWRRWGEKQGLI